ncbi:membrane protein [Tritrichomonas foetus]|uniref:Membrane protein n=1 Tax=Tritrichomonas foetus TaxID=1144522 RepID=A0A1J4KT03_9EUKA|nr:membrane protein [Tritrichomonas foetus]|eukprot:OHT14242.1 membrane protein [Tritrichomonas foetus]
MGYFNNVITRLCKRSYIGLNIFAFIMAFVCYFSMYAFRKPFTASSFEGYELWHVNYKIMCITFQVIGYTISKFIGIKFISELNPKYRGLYIIIFITVAELALILFGAIPPPYNSLLMLINGLPLGMIWGLVFSYLEGRQTSEVLGSGMCISFIISSGAVKSVGRAVMTRGISQFWMPATVGAIFYVPMLISVFCLESIPEPNEKDIAARTERVTMSHSERVDFCKIFAPGIILMTIFYMFLTAYRDFRDNFAPELWGAFGYEDTPSIFTTSEIIVAVVVVIPVGLFMLIKDNIWTFIAYYILIIAGQVLVGICTIFCDTDKLKGLYFIIITGVGLYVGYVPFNSIIFDLFLATFRYKANSGFLMYICDSFGYLASVVILFVKNFASPHLSWLDFFIYISYAISVLGTVFIALDLAYYLLKYKKWTTNDLTPEIDENYDTSSKKGIKNSDSEKIISEDLSSDSTSSSSSTTSHSKSKSSSISSVSTSISSTN